MHIDVAKHVVEAMQSAALVAHPNEACGILLGQEERISGFIATRNVHTDPTAHFEIDPQALIDAHRAAREGGPQVVGYYHSHPVGPAEPSQTDRAMASGDGRIWAIVADGGVSFWQDSLNGFAVVSHELIEE